MRSLLSLRNQAFTLKLGRASGPFFCPDSFRGLCPRTPASRALDPNRTPAALAARHPSQEGIFDTSIAREPLALPVAATPGTQPGASPKGHALKVMTQLASCASLRPGEVTGEEVGRHKVGSKAQARQAPLGGPDSLALVGWFSSSCFPLAMLNRNVSPERPTCCWIAPSSRGAPPFRWIDQHPVGSGLPSATSQGRPVLKPKGSPHGECLRLCPKNPSSSRKALFTEGAQGSTLRTGFLRGRREGSALRPALNRGFTTFECYPGQLCLCFGFQILNTPLPGLGEWGKEKVMSEVKLTGKAVMEYITKRFPQQIIDRDLAVKVKACVKCRGDASEFKDELSAKEYTISGWCQKCQDAFFG